MPNKISDYFNTSSVCNISKIYLLSLIDDNQPYPSFKRNSTCSEFEKLTALFTEVIEKQQQEEQIIASITEHSNEEYPPPLRAIAYESEKIFQWSLEAFKHPFPHVSTAHAKDQPSITPLNLAVYTIQPRIIRQIIKEGGAIDCPATLANAAIRTDKIVRGIMFKDDSISLQQPRWLPPYNSHIAIDPEAIESFLKEGTGLWVEHDVQEGIHHFSILKGKLLDIRSLDSVACVINRVLLLAMINPELLEKLSISEEFILKLDQLFPVGNDANTLRSVSLHSLFTFSKAIPPSAEESDQAEVDTTDSFSSRSTKSNIIRAIQMAMSSGQQLSPLPLPALPIEIFSGILNNTYSYIEQNKFEELLKLIRTNTEEVRPLWFGDLSEQIIEQIIFVTKPLDNKDQNAAVKLLYIALSSGQISKKLLNKLFSELIKSKAYSDESKCHLCAVAASFGALPNELIYIDLESILSHNNPYTQALNAFIQSLLCLEGIKSIHDVIEKYQTATKEIDAYLQSASLSTNRLPFEKIKEWHRLQKAPSDTPVVLPLLLSEKNKLYDAIDKFAYQYKKLASSNPLLNHISVVEYHFRHQEVPAKTAYIFSYFNRSYPSSLISKDSLFTAWHKLFPDPIDTLRHNLLHLMKKAFTQPELRSSYRTFFHGTNMHVLSSIFAMKSPALKSGRRLIEEGHPIFNGEATALNAKMGDICHDISGQIRGPFLPNKEGTPIYTYLSAVTRLGVVDKYTRLSQGSFRLSITSEETKARFSVKFYQDSYDQIKKERPDVIKNVFLVLQADLIRLRYTRSITQDEVRAFNEKFTEWLKNAQELEQYRQYTNAILHLLGQPLPAEDNKISSTFPNNPLIVGIPLSHAKTDNWYKNPNHYYLEDIESTDLRIGTAVRLLFVNHPNHYDSIWPTSITLKNVEIHTIPDAFFNELWHGLQGEKINPRNGLCYESYTEAFRILDGLIQTQVLPHYANSYPENPSFVDEKGNRIFLSFDDSNQILPERRVSYKEYQQLIEQRKIVARPLNGLIHAARTALWAQVIAILYEQHNKLPQDANVILIGLAAGLHSAGREADTITNLWRKESGMMAWECVEKFDPIRDVPANGEIYFEAIFNKMSSTQNIVSAIIHDANSLEVFRKPFFSKSNFDASRLLLSKIMNDHRLKALIAEVEEFITLTENPEFKLTMEYEVKNHHLLKLFYLLLFHRETYGKFTVICDILFPPVFKECSSPIKTDRSFLDVCQNELKTLANLTPEQEEKILQWIAELQTKASSSPTPPYTVLEEVINLSGRQVNIEIKIPNCSGLTLTDENLPTLFHLANQYILSTPYPDKSDCLISHNKKIYRPNHNGTHGARQARCLEILLDLIKNNGNENAKQINSELTSLDKLNLLLAAYLLRSGRINENPFNSKNPDDYATRSGKIYYRFANQLKINESTSKLIEEIIADTGKSPQKYVALNRVNINEKSKFIYDCFQIIHKLDLMRCFSEEKMNVVHSEITKYLATYFEDAESYTKDLLNFNYDLCLKTGSAVKACDTDYDMDLFTSCSLDGKLCWEKVQEVEFIRYSQLEGKNNEGDHDPV